MPQMGNLLQELVSSKYHGEYYCKTNLNSLLNSPIFVFKIFHEINSYERCASWERLFHISCEKSTLEKNVHACHGCLTPL